ncbi:restriction endonuclease subunit S, partial [Klebsiella oxytoca]
FALQLLEKDKATILSDKNGSAMVHITKTGMEEKSVLLPINIEEQSKIGMCLDSIDHLITFHQRKCDTAKVLKKY